MDTESDGDTPKEPEGNSRRDLLKKGLIGAGAAGVVWAAPKVEGLSVRPDYASAASTGTIPGVPGNYSGSVSPLSQGSTTVQLGNAPGSPSATVLSNFTGNTVTVNYSGPANCGFSALNYAGISFDDSPFPASVTLNANQIIASPVVPGADDNGFGGVVRFQITCT